MAKKTSGKTAKKKVKASAGKTAASKTVMALKAAKKGKAAKLKKPAAKAKADNKAMHGKIPPWKPAEVEEAFRRFADRVLAFYDGTVIADQTPREVLANPKVQMFISGTKPGEGAHHA